MGLPPSTPVLNVDKSATPLLSEAPPRTSNPADQGRSTLSTGVRGAVPFFTPNDGLLVEGILSHSLETCSLRFIQVEAQLGRSVSMMKEVSGGNPPACRKLKFMCLGLQAASLIVC